MRWFLLSLFFLSSLSADPAEEKKVVFLTVPKGGTHLLKKAVEKISQKPLRWFAVSKNTPAQIEQKLLKAPEQCYIVHLFEGTSAILDLNPELFNLVLLIRDPRDTLISFLYHILDKGRWINGQKNYNSKLLQDLSYDEQLAAVLGFPLELASPCSSLLIASQYVNHPDLTIIRFEDLVGDKGGGSDQAQRETLLTIANCMGIALMDNELDSIQSDLFGKTWTFRKGLIGEWRTGYSEENKEIFKSLFGEVTIDLGYATDLDW